MPDLTSLLERVRAASGPDRNLGRDLANAFRAREDYWDLVTLFDFATSESIDAIGAAVALVEVMLPGWHAEIGCGNAGRVAWCVLHEFPEPCRRVPENGVILGNTTPLAILAALLTVMQKD